MVHFWLVQGTAFYKQNEVVLLPKGLCIGYSQRNILPTVPYTSQEALAQEVGPRLLSCSAGQCGGSLEQIS